MKKSWHIRTWDLRHTTMPAHRRHRDWRQREIKNIVGWKRFTFLTHEMDYSGYTFLYKVLGKINVAQRGNAVLDMGSIPVSFVNPDTTYLSLFLCSTKFSTDLIYEESAWGTSSVRNWWVFLCIVFAHTQPEPALDTAAAFLPFVLCSVILISVMWTHALPQEVAAAAGYHFLELMHLRCVADVVHVVVVQSVVDIWRCTRCSDQHNWAYFYATSVLVL